MPLVPIEEAPAGRALDQAVHTILFGAWDEQMCRICGWRIEEGYCQPGDCSMRPPPERRSDEPINFSNPSGTFFSIDLVINELTDLGVRFTRSRKINGVDSPLRTTVYVLDKGVWWADGHGVKALTLACCRAFCAVNGVKEIEVG